MSDDPVKTAIANNDLLLVDKNGDPLHRGTLMIEKESYERIIEGHKIAADAARHLARRESKSRDKWIRVADALDFSRRHVAKLAGLEAVQTQQVTTDGKGDGLGWRDARTRFREGLRQAAGGMRQMATCHRGVLQWSAFARRIEDMERNLLAIVPTVPAAKQMIRLDG